MSTKRFFLVDVTRPLQQLQFEMLSVHRSRCISAEAYSAGINGRLLSFCPQIAHSAVFLLPLILSNVLRGQMVATSFFVLDTFPVQFSVRRPAMLTHL